MKRITKFLTFLYRRKPSIYRLIALTTVFALIAPLLLKPLFTPATSQAAWYDDLWTYRQKITFTHNADISADRAVTFSLDTAELITAGVMQSDCDDSRFTDINGRVLRYQLTGTCNNAATTYEIVFPAVFNAVNVGYVYYGNPSAVSASEDVSSITALTPSGGDPSITTRTIEEKTPGPVAYWNFDEGYGTNTNDVTTNNNDGTISGATWQNEEMCVSGKCLKFDGTNDYVQVADSDTLDIGTNNFSISGWFRASSTGTDTRIISKADSSDGTNQIDIRIQSNNTLRLFIRGATTGAQSWVDSTSTLNDNKWHHFTVTVVNSTQTLKLYINGIDESVVGGSSWDGTTLTNTDPLYLGRNYGGGEYFKGSIDEIKIYPYERSAAEVKADYLKGAGASGSATTGGGNNTTGGSQSFLSDGLVGYWKMEDSGIDAEGEAITDSSGNSNSGTLFGDNGTGDNGSGMNCTATGKFGTSCNFDGTDDYIQNTNLSTALSSDVTLAFWLNMQSADQNSSTRIIDLAQASGQGMSIHSGTNEIIGLDDAGGPTNNILTSGAYKDNNWHHVVARRSNTTYEFFVDGQSIGTTTGTAPTYTRLFLGTQNSLLSTTFYEGLLDDVRIYNRALTSAEVTALYEWAPGPVAHWKMDENTGQSANDVSGNGNTGTLGASSSSGSDDPIWDTGKFGGSLNFDGSNDFVSTSQKTFTYPMTVSFWAKTDDTASTQSFVYESQDTGGNGGGTQNECNIFTDQFYCKTENTVHASTTFSLFTNTNWHHMSVVLDSTYKIYYDGVLTTSGALTGTPNFTNYLNQTLIGKPHASQRFLNGQIDDVRIYNYARSQKQIVSDMNAGHPAVGSPVGSAVAYYAFDEGYGSTANNSGNGGSTLNGTLTPGATGTNTTAAAMWDNNGKFNKAVEFDGTDDYVDAGSASPLEITGDLSVSTWFKISSFSGTPVLLAFAGSGETQATNFLYELFFNSATSVGYLHESGAGVNTVTTTTGTTISTGTWHQILLVRDTTAKTIKIYLNGDQYGTTQTYTTNTDGGTTSNLYIGAGGPATNLFPGSIDEVKVYNYALSPEEVKVDYNRAAVLSFTTTSTDSSGNPDNSAAREYCVPGDTSSCSAPILELNFNENTGSTVNDTSGSGFSPTLSGAAWTTGKVGSALDFDGTDDYVEIADSSTLEPFNDMTVEAWIRRENSVAADKRIVSKWGDTVGERSWLMQLNTSGTTVAFIVQSSNGNNIATSSTVIQPNVWYHVVGVRRNSATYIYVNGVQDGNSSAIPAGTTSSTSNLRIGHEGDGSLPSQYFDGVIDQVKVYDYARTAGQIAWAYNKGAPVGWWQFDECQGTTAYDNSGNGNNGTITPGAGSNTTAGTCSSGTSSEMWNDGTTGKRNASLGFDGTDDYVTVADNNLFTFSDGSDTDRPFSVSSWIYFNSGNSILSKYQTGQGEWRIRVVTDKIQFQLYDQSASGLLGRETSSGSISSGTWYHVVGTYSGSEAASGIDIYINGIALDSADASSGSYSGMENKTGEVQIGQTGGDTNFGGQIDDVRIYNYALTANQIKTLYNDGAVRFGPATGQP